ncbi:hypothetical protein ABW20_dc0104187 [Dactylellina cionopaga]|nr:hypothetical protein ABW20_dc0104187 [Dactylellina cionopaga]
MRSSLILTVVLWQWASSVFGVHESETYKFNAYDRRAVEENDNGNRPTDTWLGAHRATVNRFAKYRTVAGSTDGNPTPKRSGVNLGHIERRADPNDPPQVMSFNMQPMAQENDPYAARKNPARLHQEYFCHWRSTKPGFDLLNAHNYLSSYLNSYPTDMCSGPGGFCTPVWCKDRYIVAVCNWNDKPWQIPCFDVINQARDIIVAIANRDPDLWKNGLHTGTIRSERQQTNDRKKICVDHASVYQPEMLGYTWFNTNPHFQIQLFYGFPPERITCPKAGLMDGVVGIAMSQEDYLEKWYGIPSEKTLAKEDNGGKKDDAGKKAKPGAPRPEGSTPTDKGTYPLPLDTSVPGYVGPNLKDYDPIEFIPPNEVNQYLHDQWVKSHPPKTADTKTKTAKESGKGSGAKPMPKLEPSDSAKATTTTAAKAANDTSSAKETIKPAGTNEATSEFLVISTIQSEVPGETGSPVLPEILPIETALANKGAKAGKKEAPKEITRVASAETKETSTEQSAGTNTPTITPTATRSESEKIAASSSLKPTSSSAA